MISVVAAWAAVVVAAVAAYISWLQARRARDQVEVAREQTQYAREQAEAARVQARHAEEQLELVRRQDHERRAPTFTAKYHNNEIIFRFDGPEQLERVTVRLVASEGDEPIDKGDFGDGTGVAELGPMQPGRDLSVPVQRGHRRGIAFFEIECVNAAGEQWTVLVKCEMRSVRLRGY